MSVTKAAADFNSLEREIYTGCCSAGREALKEQLEKWDGRIRETRDRSIYRHKGQRKTVLKTVMGEVEYSRTIYERRNEDGTKSFVYLLDEAMGKTGSGFMSGVLSGQIAEAVCAGSYRRAAQSVSEMTGQTISHQAAWNVIQTLGRRVDAHEKAAAALSAKSKGTGTQEVEVLFEEQDGIWLHLQGKSRKQYGSSHEMKVAIAYDGARRIGKKRYELTGKVACANFEPVSKFVCRKEGKIAETYCVDEIKTRILNGDGAQWIKQSISDEEVVFQLDAFHRNKAIRQYVRNPQMQKAIFKLLYTKQIDHMLDFIEALSNSVDDEAEEEGLRVLHAYFTNNKDGLVGYHRRGLNLPEPPEGKEYRRLGAMESNIFTIIGNRMKGGRACWSIDGGNNLARLLTLKHTKKLHETLDGLTNWVLPAKYAEEVTVKMTPRQIPMQAGKGYEGRHVASFPSKPEYKWLRAIGKINPEFGL
jgi:hypothetical protein